MENKGTLTTKTILKKIKKLKDSLIDLKTL